MDRSKDEWRQWFKVCMMLNDHGFIPGDPRMRSICGRAEVIQRWGLAVEFVEGVGAPCRGYEFRDEDGERYHMYVIELFERVHQRKLLRRVLPFHFARGLAVEASGGAVDWVTFAMTRCFAAHKKSQFVALDEYTEVEAPLPWNYEKILPPANSVVGPQVRQRHVSCIKQNPRNNFNSLLIAHCVCTKTLPRAEFFS